MAAMIRVGMTSLLALMGVIWMPLAAQQAAPTGLQGSATGPTTVALSWTAPATAVRYWVQRAIGTATFANLATPKISTPAFTDAAAPAGTTVRYRVIAGFSTGPKTYSAAISVTTPAAGSTASSPAAAPAPSLAKAAAPPELSSSAPRAEVPAGPGAVPSSPVVGTSAVATATLVPLQPIEAPTGRTRLAPAPAPTPTPAPAPSTVTPVNPSGFIAKPTGDGQVQLSWQPVDGASYYVLLGPGVPEGGTRVSGTTTFTATGVAPGLREWAVASYYEPGPVSTPAAEFPRARATLEPMVLTGWADLHTHPMINLAFGGKLVHGGVDVGSLLPQDLTCHGATRATSIEHALGDDRPSHGGHDFLNFPCGDELRKLLIHEFQVGNHALVTNNPGRGYPDFLDWPKWNDITHQKMWYEWLRRARDGGLRVMVALATNNRTLADAVTGPGDAATDDKTSADLQVNEIKSFVGRHPDFMEVAYGAADIKRIVQLNKIAVVLGIEIDNMGNFNQLPPQLMVYPLPAQDIIRGEINRLYAEGVRYVLPIHVSDNVFGGTAIYKDDFNTANLRETGHFWEIECADAIDDISYTYTESNDPLRAVGAFIKLGLDPLRHSGPGPTCPGGGGKSKGHRNMRGLTMSGIFAVKEMMKRGMIVDIDHMSHLSAEKTLEIGEQFGYPIVSGHSGIRGPNEGSNAENSRTRSQLARISKLHGMFGLGSDGTNKSTWSRQYQTAMNVMGYPTADPAKAVYRNGAISFGSDLNGLVRGPAPGGLSRTAMYVGGFQPSKSGSKTWYYDTDGVAHYGMMADFVVDLRTAQSNEYTGAEGIPLGVSGADLVDNHLNRSANYFWQMWELIEARKSNVQ